MQTIVELPEFLKRSGKLLKGSERQGMVSFLASHPESGEIMKGEHNEVATLTSLLVKSYGGRDE